MMTWSQYDELRIAAADFPLCVTNLSLLIEDEERLFGFLASVSRGNQVVSFT